MSVRERILALRLLEKQKKHPEHVKQIGIEVKMKEKREKKIKESCIVKVDTSKSEW